MLTTSLCALLTLVAKTSVCVPLTSVRRRRTSKAHGLKSVLPKAPARVAYSSETRSAQAILCDVT